MKVLLNKNRYNSLKQALNELNISLPEEQIKSYSNIFEYFAHITENKFTDIEMVAIYSLLGKVLHGQEPHMAAVIIKEERIRTIVRIIEELPLTSGKLSMDAKLRIAFCELMITGVHRQPDGVVFDVFDSIERVEMEYNHFKNAFPSWFDTTKTDEIVFYKKGYGIIAENPIQTTSIWESSKYLNSLRYNGRYVLYERINPCKDARGNLLDNYRIYSVKGILSPRKEYITNLYINPNCKEAIEIAPIGFTLEER